MSIVRRCRKCDSIKSRDEFHDDPTMKGGKRKICKECFNAHTRIRQRAHYQENRTEIRKRKNLWAMMHPDETKQQKRRNREANPARALFNSAKHRAKEKNLPFDLELTDIDIPEKCPYCNESMEVAVGLQSRKSYNLDRIVPKLGYVRTNVEVICAECNTKKGGASAEEHRRFANRMDEASIQFIISKL